MLRRGTLGMVGLVAAAAPLVLVGAYGAREATVAIDLGPFGTSQVGAVLDPWRAALLALVLLVSTVVAGYVSANLVGQRRVGRFVALQALLAASLALTVTAPSLVQLALVWTGTTWATAALVSHAGSERAAEAARRVRRSLVVGDVLVWSSALLAAAATGTTDVAAQVPGSLAGVVVAGLLVAAGLIRSAQVPMHRWLQETTEAPSPVSALLHAGVVNGVGVVVLVAWPLVAASVPARALAVLGGAATIAIGWATSRVRPDVKGRLVSSTGAQMGYLAVVAGLGLPAAVLIHLVGHGLWKATLFLGAGSAVDRVRRAGGTGHVARRRVRAVAAALAAAAVLLAAALPWPGLLAGPSTLLLLLAAALTAAVAAAATVTVRPVRPAAARGAGRAAALVPLAAVIAAGVGYVLVVRAAESALAGALPPAAAAWGAPGSWAELAVVLGLAAAAVLAWRLDRRAVAGAGHRLVGWAARQTLPAPPLRRPLTVPAPADPQVAPGAVGSTAPAGGTVEGDETRRLVEVAGDVVAPLWPLHAFVASNPLAGLEPLGFRGALAAASASWGSRPGIDATVFRAAVAQGAVDADVLARVCRAAAPGPDVPVASAVRSRAELVQVLLTEDAVDAGAVAEVAARLEQVGSWTSTTAPVRTPGEHAALADPRLADAQQRARDLVSMHAARVLGDPAWPAPGGVLAALRDTGADRALGLVGVDAMLASLPDQASQALAVLVARLRSGGDEVLPVLTRLLARDPGFVAHLQWRRRVGLDAGLDRITDLLAARLALDVAVAAAGPAGVGAPPADDELARGVALLLPVMGLDPRTITDDVLMQLAEIVDAVLLAGPEMLRLRAWEDSYRTPLLAGLAGSASALAESAVAPADTAAAQVITCIDVRSEPLRRRLEALGPWETLGAAGFFGIPLQHVGATGAVSDRMPALLLPDRQVTETGACTLRTTVSGSVEHAAHGPDHVAGAAFALADAAGWAAGPWAVLRTFAPRLADTLAQRWRQAQAPRRTALHLERDTSASLGFGLDELADRAQAFLAVVGLERPAPLVMLLGHGAHVTNQPHVAAYDCGACGGNPGDVSARAMAQVLNDSRVRELLAQRGVLVPEDTVFVAALHSTTDSSLLVLDEVPAHAQPVLQRLVDDIRIALRQGADAAAGAARAADWAQARPEWGLARNAALVIGPRALTAGLDLDGRVFLHSYRHDLDADGGSLEFLLTAPMVVAQWISTQYWASTVDPGRFGAGDKTLHNSLCRYDFGPSPLTGVLVGARGDVRIGLPWQAVSERAPVDGAWDALPHHEPLRLLVVVHAECAAIDGVLERRPEAGRLVSGEWVSLVAAEPSTGRLLQRLPDGGWVEADPERAPDRIGTSRQE